MGLLRKLFIDGEWNIAIRKRSLKESDIFGYTDGFISIPHNKQYWFADPLLFSSGGHEFLFCEAFNKKTMKGDIGVFDCLSNEPSCCSIIIQNNYHMSFPYVFEHSGFFYMIPETSENRTIELYKADNFPLEWRKKAVLISGLSLVDTVVFEIDSNLYLYSYENDRMIGHFYKLNLSS